MRSRRTMAIAAILVFTAQAAANDQLIAQLKARGKVIDDLSASISKAQRSSVSRAAAAA